jgi:hypothetical protein
MLAICACVNERPDEERNSLVRVSEPGSGDGAAPRAPTDVGKGTPPAPRMIDVEGDAEMDLKGWSECALRRRYGIVVPVGEGVTDDPLSPLLGTTPEAKGRPSVSAVHLPAPSDPGSFGTELRDGATDGGTVDVGRVVTGCTRGDVPATAGLADE